MGSRGPCHLCGAANAPFGFRRPGRVLALGADAERILRACPDCRAAAEARWRARFAEAQGAPRPAKADPATPETTPRPPAPGLLI